MAAGRQPELLSTAMARLTMIWKLRPSSATPLSSTENRNKEPLAWSSRTSLRHRRVTTVPQVDQMYETAGSSAQVTLVIRGEEGNSSSVVLSPDDDDPQGELLPLVHVDPSGGFTMEAFEGDERPGAIMLASAAADEPAGRSCNPDTGQSLR